MWQRRRLACGSKDCENLFSIFGGFEITGISDFFGFLEKILVFGGLLMEMNVPDS
jgi:hypothetical protein